MPKILNLACETIEPMEPEPSFVPPRPSNAAPAPVSSADPTVAPVEGDVEGLAPAASTATAAAVVQVGPLGPADETVPPTPGGANPGRPRLWRRLVRPVIATAVVLVATVVLRGSGTLLANIGTFEAMGFDPDRARLLTDLVGAAIAVAAAVLITGSVRWSALAGTAAGLALFAHTFYDETRAALASSGPAGVFDPTGWLLSILTLVVAFAVVAWASAALVGVVRSALLSAASDLAAFVRSDRTAGRLGRALALVLAVTMLALALPTFGDMVNYSPDAHMRGGHALGPGLAQAAGGTLPGGGATAAVRTPGPGAAGTSTGSAPGGSARWPSTSRSGPAPWAAWTPSGQGQLTSATIPGPWTGGQSPLASLDVYLPPGYGSSSRAYPVIYAVPWAAHEWTAGANLTSMLDALITSGAFPASIVVFVSEKGGPYWTSECANSYDGREWYETYLTTTVIAYIDTTYRTIRTAAARSLLGFSAGGFCAAMLALRHPDLFSTEISISGYYQAGVVSNQTPNAYRPFGGRRAIEAAYSPIGLVGTLSPTAKASLQLVLEGDPTDPFYGAQYTAMVAAAESAGLNVSANRAPAGHAWQTVRAMLPQLLGALADHQAALGVFS